MNFWKKLSAVCFAAALVLSLAGCGEHYAEMFGIYQSPASSEPAVPEQSAAPEGSTAPAGGTVRIATKPMTEQYILGEMLGLLVEDAGYDAEITKGIGGGTSNIQPAMEKGEFDLYPEYTSSGWVMVLGHEAGSIADSEMLAQLQKEYQERFGMTWAGLYGFNNTYTVVVREAVADQYGLKTTSDLAAVAGELNFGGNPDYIERADGFPALCETYGLEFKTVSDIDIGLKYQAIKDGAIDVTNGYTTDAQLANPDTKAVALEDDKNLQVNYFCSTVVRQDALERFPGLEDALMKLDGALSDGEMAELNYKVEVEGLDEKDVARDFLTQKGLLNG